MKGKRKPSKPYLIAEKFVKEILKREWLISDNKIAMAHAKSLLQDYEFNDIMGCLDAIRDGIIEPPLHLQTLAALRKFEPPIMERWFEYKRTPPPVYLELQYAEWERRVKAEYFPVTEDKEDEACQPSLLSS